MTGTHPFIKYQDYDNGVGCDLFNSIKIAAGIDMFKSSILPPARHFLLVVFVGARLQFL